MIFKYPKHGLKKGFTMIEMIIAVSLFLLVAGIGMGAYFRYYDFSLINADINNVITQVKYARAESLKNATNDDYGIRIDVTARTLTIFRDTYDPSDTANKTLRLEKLGIKTLNLNPVPGVTSQILFENRTGKTANYGTFTIGNDNIAYAIAINPQGAID
jgi:prepilin-type N-terminal cleavage/methylation domain-containing protein